MAPPWCDWKGLPAGGAQGRLRQLAVAVLACQVGVALAAVVYVALGQAEAHRALKEVCHGLCHLEIDIWNGAGSRTIRKISC